MFYILLVTDYPSGIEDDVVFSGKRPFITNRKERAEVYKEELEKEFPEAHYRLAEVRII